MNWTKLVWDIENVSSVYEWSWQNPYVGFVEESYSVFIAFIWLSQTHSGLLVRIVDGRIIITHFCWWYSLDVSFNTMVWPLNLFILISTVKHKLIYVYWIFLFKIIWVILLLLFSMVCHLHVLGGTCHICYTNIHCRCSISCTTYFKTKW